MDQHPDAFYPGKGGSLRFAKLICSRCMVQDECLEQALKTSERFGVWGGLSEEERSKYVALTNGSDPLAATDYLAWSRRVNYSIAKKIYCGRSGLTISTSKEGDEDGTLTLVPPHATQTQEEAQEAASISA